MPKKPKINTLVTMYVNTGFSDLSQHTIEDHVWMGDSNADVENNNAGKVKNYCTGTIPDGNVTWVPAVYHIDKTPKNYVLITDVVFTGDHKDDIKVSKEPKPTKGFPTHVNGKVSQNVSKTETIQYKILFTVYRDGQDPLPLYIDPRIQINSD